MLNPHEFHNIEIRKKSERKDSEVVYWCTDCDVRCWEHGERIGGYFDFKDNSEYELNSCIAFLEYMSKLKSSNLQTLANDSSEILRETKEMLADRNPIV